MTEEQFRKLVIAQLEQRGMKVEPIPEVNDGKGIKTADLRAALDSENYVIELKQRERAEKYVVDVNKLEVGEVAELIPEALEYRNAISRTVRDGVEQLNATALSEGDFRILWLDSGEIDPELDSRQYEATLCGEVHFFSLDHDHLMSCYFFSESEFFRSQNGLDGAIISDGESWKFILNPYSPRYERLKVSRFVKELKGAAWDPIEMEKEKKLMIADCALDRNKPDLILRYITEKYGYRLNIMPMRRYGAIIRVNVE